MRYTIFISMLNLDSTCERVGNIMKKGTKLLTLLLAGVTLFGSSISVEASSGPLVYTMGDSVMDGIRNSFVGTADTLCNEYGYSIGLDAAHSGTIITDSAMSVSLFSQYNQVEWAIGKYGYDANTIFVLDGGTNDISFYCKDMDRSGSSTLTISGGADRSRDIAASTEDLLTKICERVGNEPGKANNVKIFFLIPNMQAAEYHHNANWDTGVNQYLAAQKASVQKFSDRGVIMIDLGEILDASTDLADIVHPNKSGYDKIASEIMTYIK